MSDVPIMTMGVVMVPMSSHSGEEATRQCLSDEHDVAPMSSYSLHKTLPLNHRWKRGLYRDQPCRGAEGS